MKVMMLMKMAESPENLAPPSDEAIRAMHNFNEALAAAGVLKDQVLGGLTPTQFGKRLQFSGKKLTVIDGPFTETKRSDCGLRAMGREVHRGGARVGEEVSSHHGLRG